MKIKILGICDMDGEYADRLIRYISERQGIMLKPIGFTNRESLIKYLSENHIDMLLISPEMMGDDLPEKNIQKIILLSSGLISSDYVNYSSVYKYQSSEAVIREVLNYFTDIKENENMIAVSRGNTKIIGVYSPVRQIGQTTFALTMGQILSRDASVLYINMEEFSALEKVFPMSDYGDLSDLMYFYRQNPEMLPIKLPAIIHHYHGMDYIPPLLYSVDLRNVKTEEWAGMIRKIADMGAYDNIILDISSMIENIFKMINICHISYMPVNSRWISLMKVSVYEEYLLKSDREDILSKTKKVNIPEINVDKFDENYLEQQILGNLGNIIRNVLKEAG